jgi:hypothetical protein
MAQLEEEEYFFWATILENIACSTKFGCDAHRKKYMGMREDQHIGTLLQIPSKSRDGEKARLGLKHMGMLEDQHPLIKNGKYTLPPALYYLGNDEKTYLSKFL